MNITNIKHYDPRQPEPKHGMKRKTIQTLGKYFAARMKGFPDPDVCWIWTRATTNNGYGCLGFNNYAGRANRVIWELTTGPIPPNLEVCHTCDVPACCNPNHLFIGTHLKNMRDMEKKGRDRKAIGTHSPWAKLNDDKVRVIRGLYATDNYSFLDLARMFKVAKSTIRHIVKRTKWSHVK